MGVLKWILGLGLIGIVITVFIIFIALVAFVFVLNTPVDPSGPNVYSDDTVLIVFPEWCEGNDGLMGTNDFFTLNLNEARSYALNYYSKDKVSDYTPQGLANVYKNACSTGQYGYTQEFTVGAQNMELQVVCFTAQDEYLDSIERCVASGMCDGTLFSISVVQDLESNGETFSSIPLNEFKQVVTSTRCR
ncbi:hypothetical protein K8R43_03540 [archaeon]|nr:hypothetical protein [archaeon]